MNVNKSTTITASNITKKIVSVLPINLHTCSLIFISQILSPIKLPKYFSCKLVLSVVFLNVTYTVSGLSNYNIMALILMDSIILFIVYNVGDTNTTSSAYLNDPANILPTWQPKPRSCNPINTISTSIVNNKDNTAP